MRAIKFYVRFSAVGSIWEGRKAGTRWWGLEGVGKSKLELTYEFGHGWKGSIFTPVTSNLSALRQQKSLKSHLKPTEKSNLGNVFKFIY